MYRETCLILTEPRRKLSSGTRTFFPWWRQRTEGSNRHLLLLVSLPNDLHGIISSSTGKSPLERIRPDTLLPAKMQSQLSTTQHTFLLKHLLPSQMSPPLPSATEKSAQAHVSLYASDHCSKSDDQSRTLRPPRLCAAHRRDYCTGCRLARAHPDATAAFAAPFKDRCSNLCVACGLLVFGGGSGSGMMLPFLVPWRSRRMDTSRGAFWGMCWI